MSDASNIQTPASAQVLAFPERRTGKSFYELYPMPFFDASTRNSWSVRPTGDYRKDIDTWKDYATQFLLSNDGTVG
jgi:hypothetical protein